MALQVEALGDVILIGMLLSVASSCALFFFDDECTLGEESEAINHSASGASAAYALVLSMLAHDVGLCLAHLQLGVLHGFGRCPSALHCGARHLRRHARGPHAQRKASGSFRRLRYRQGIFSPSCCYAAADLEEAAATGHKLEYGWTSINFLLPAVLLFSDAIFGLAAGMTVKCERPATLLLRDPHSRSAHRPDADARVWC